MMFLVQMDCHLRYLLNFSIAWAVNYWDCSSILVNLSALCLNRLATVRSTIVVSAKSFKFIAHYVMNRYLYLGLPLDCIAQIDQIMRFVDLLRGFLSWRSDYCEQPGVKRAFGGMQVLDYWKIELSVLEELAMQIWLNDSWFIILRRFLWFLLEWLN